MKQAEFIPYQIAEIELSQPLSDLRPHAGYAVQRALVLVRLHSMPIGMLELELAAAGMSAEQLAAQIWRALGPQVNEHLRQDGLPPVDMPQMGGLAYDQQPNCLQERARLLEDAPFISVIVATHNRLDTLAPCLDSLLAQEYPDFDVIVVDNAPADEATADYIRERFSGSSKVRYVREDLPGLARAHNCGLRETDAPYVAITDDDVIVDRYWLAELLRGFRQAENVGCVTGMIFPAEIETEAQYLIERSVGYAKGYNSRQFNLADHRLKHPLFPYAAGTFGSGANMAFDSAALRALGGFDDSLGAGSIALGGDDLAAFFDVVAAGYTLVYQPSAIIYHRHHQAYERLRQTAYGYGAGLTAYLTKTVLERPGRVLDLARRVPHGLYHALSPKSGKNARKDEGYPRELTWIERKGMLNGPVLYLRSRWQTRQARERSRSSAGSPSLPVSQRH